VSEKRRSRAGRTHSSWWPLQKSGSTESSSWMSSMAPVATFMCGSPAAAWPGQGKLGPQT